jgi:hypothetical protein
LPTEFWRNSGFHLLERDAAGRLAITDDFLHAYYLRPEIHPVEESGERELALHASLMTDPRRSVAENEILEVEDEDARHNYRILLGFRERLLAAGTVEGAYMTLFKGAIDVPPMFIDQLVHVVMRNILDSTDDGLQARAAELFFRSQKASLQDGHVMVADHETVEMHAAGSRYGSIGRLIVEAQGSLGAANLDVLERANAALYWSRESKHDTVVSLTYGRPALDAFARVIELWIAHFLNLAVRVRPVRRIEEPHWAWHVGLDAESTAILNELWAGREVDPGRMRNILALFALHFDDPAAMRADIAGRAVYLALSADEGVVRMKPQNLLLNLPLHEA